MKDFAKNRLMPFLLVAITALCALFGVILTTPNTVKADASSFGLVEKDSTFFSDYETKEIEVGDNLSGKWIRKLSGNVIITCSNFDSRVDYKLILAWHENIIINDTSDEILLICLSNENNYEDPSGLTVCQDESGYIYVYIPENLSTIGYIEDEEVQLNITAEAWQVTGVTGDGRVEMFYTPTETPDTPKEPTDGEQPKDDNGKASF